jgi:hypothetical protein
MTIVRIVKAKVRIGSSSNSTQTNAQEAISIQVGIGSRGPAPDRPRWIPARVTHALFLVGHGRTFDEKELRAIDYRSARLARPDL